MPRTEITNVRLPSLGFPWALHVKEVKEWLFISGVPPMDEAGKVVEHDLIGQFRYEVERIRELLVDAGMGMEDLVYLTVTVTEKADLYKEWTRFGEAYLAFFPAGKGPAGGTLRIAQGLSHPKMLVEVEAIAAR